MKWKDSYRSYKDKTINESELKLSRFRFVIHRHIDYPKDVWLSSCYGLFTQRELKNKDLDKAKIEAVNIVKKILNKTLSELK